MKKYLSLVKFSHTIFALPFALIGFFLAYKVHHYEFSLKIFVLMVLCMVFARSAAMAFNRYLDADIDALNPRTKVREIPAGVISKSNALIFTLLNAILFVTTTFFINKLCFLLSPIALLVILGYSYTKTFTPLCHLVLGLGLSFAPIGAYLTLSNEFNYLPILFSFTVFFWVSGFDIIYALQDEEFDKQHQLKSIPSVLGKVNALKVSQIFHLITPVFLFFAGKEGNFGILYWIGFVLFISLLIYQHKLVKPYDLSKVNIAFFTTNGIASTLFAFLTIMDMFV